ncbi:MAG: hypothetical protein KIT43_12385 [Bauldia sp.]|nr:hypothetical protein [Bauldia sp.]
MRHSRGPGLILASLLAGLLMVAAGAPSAFGQGVRPPAATAATKAPADPWVFDPAEPTVLRLRGAIAPGAATAFEAALAEHPRVRTLILSGDGTVQAETIAIARRVRDLGLATRIEAGDYCHLACGIVFLAGPQRRAEGILCVAVLFADTVDLDKAQLDLADFIELVMSFDLSEDLLSSIIETSSGGAYCFSPHEIARFGIDEPVVDAPAGWDATPYAVLYEQPNNDAPKGAPWPSHTTIARWSLGDGANGPEIRLVADVPDLGVTITVTAVADPQSVDRDSRGMTVTLRADTPPDFPGGGVADLAALLSRAHEATAGIGGFYEARPTGAPQEYAVRIENDLAWPFARVHFSRRWLSFVLTYETGAVAELLIEVGAEGRAVIDAAYAAWDAMAPVVPAPPSKPVRR